MKLHYIFLLVTNFLSILCSAQDTFSKVQEKLKQAPYWEYPYPQIINYLKDKGEKSLLIFSYGSLMDGQSAATSLSEASLVTRRPGVAFGIRRLFDRDIPVDENSKWGVPNDPQARGMLNVLLSNRIEDFINGVLVEVVLEDIPNVLHREEDYDLIPIVAQNWNSVCDDQKPCYFIAYTFYAPQNKKATNSAILPRPGYYELTRDSSLKYGELFYRMWLKTTFLADGMTPITEWEKKVQEENEQTKKPIPHR